MHFLDLRKAVFSTIIHPTNLTDASIPALLTAHELASRLNAKLIVCFIAQSPQVATGTTLTNPETNEVREIEAELKSHLPEDSALAFELRIFIAEKSTPVKKLLGFIDVMESDLLVMGMHRREGVAGWLSHSITEDVVRLANCAVLVVKQIGIEYEYDEKTDGGS